MKRMIRTLAVLLAILGGSAAFAQVNGVYNNVSIAGKTQITGNMITPDGPSQTIKAWGNSQTQGFGISGCNVLTCHPSTAWPAVFAAGMGGWVLDNQAYGSSQCADLAYAGTSESLWDTVITTGSKNIFAHYRNDQSQYGPAPYRMDFARGCIQGLTAWLAIPETGKLRASASTATTTGAWTFGSPNSAAGFTASAGSTWSASVTGSAVYVWGAKQYGSNTTYTISVDGVLVYDSINQTTTLSEGMDCNQISGSDCNPGHPTNTNILPYLYRVPGLANAAHAIVYTCVNPAGGQCIMFGAAGVDSDNGTKDGPFVYSLSPVPDGPGAGTGFMAPAVTAAYYEQWKQVIAELRGDGLQIVGIDAMNPRNYNPADPTQVQADNVHPTITGAANIAAAALSKGTSASVPLDHGEGVLHNVTNAYGGLFVGPIPSTAPVNPGFTNTPLPVGVLGTSTGPSAGRTYYGADGRAFFGRHVDDSNTLLYGSGHLFQLYSLDAQAANLAVPGQLTSDISSTNGGGRVRAKNGSDVSDDLMEGAGGDGQPNWPGNAVLTTTKNRVINADGGSIFFQSNRVTVATITATTRDYYWTATGCSLGTGQPARCTGTTTLPGAMSDANWQLSCTADAGALVGDFLCSPHAAPLPTASGATINYALVQVMQNGGSGGSPTVYFHAHHN